MIKKTILSILAFTIAFSCFAQNIEVLESSHAFDKSSRPALMVTIPMADEGMVEKEWKRLVKEFKPEDFKNKKEMFADNALIPRLSENTVDIYAVVEEKGDQVTLYVAIDMGGAFLSSTHGDKQEVMKGIIRDFAIQIVQNVYDEKIKEQEKVVTNLTKEVEKANSDKDHLQKEIETYQERIENNKIEIEELTKTIEEQGKELGEEQKILEEIKKEASEIK